MSQTPNRTRDKAILVRVTEAEREAIQAEAERFGITVSELVRALPRLGEVFRFNSIRVERVERAEDTAS